MDKYCICACVFYTLLCYVSGQFVAPGQNTNGCPNMLMCPKYCPYGYVVNTAGCRLCDCIETPIVNGLVGAGSVLNPGGVAGAGVPVLTGSQSYSTPCIPGSSCSLTCQYGYATNVKSGCQFCVCAPDPATVYHNPCVNNAPSTCDLTCGPRGYTHGPGGCQYCICADYETQTDPPMTIEEKCMMKLTSCQARYKYGFMTDDTCELCIGKDEIYKASNVALAQQPNVMLDNPCIQGYHHCMITCSSGYRTGPRSCQYCACQE